MNGIQENQRSESAQSVNLPIGIEKRCPKCGEVKSTSEFYKSKIIKSGVQKHCKVCHNGICKKWKNEHRERVKELWQRWEKSEKSKIGHRRWAAANRGKYRGYRAKWKEKNKDYSSTYYKKLMEENPEKRRFLSRQQQKRKYATLKGCLNSRMTSNISASLDRSKSGRPWECLVGYTVDQLKKHLEGRFVEGMSWSNRGQWHIDHKIPISAFNFNNPEDIDFKRCWALKNLQPMWAKENRMKKAKLEKPFQPSLQIQI